MTKKKATGSKTTPATATKIDLTSPKTVCVLVPDSIGDLKDDPLKSLAHVVAHAGELSLGKPPHAAIENLAIIKTSKVKKHVKKFVADWPKSIPQGC
ncbi:MAG TPA: hypothetical protein VEI07_09640 [Planctomycetaceae bacterium]|nr:hypothetical protein [Planctomycetaceae bacterium]